MPAATLTVPLIAVPEGMHSDGLEISADRKQVKFPSGEAAQALLSTRLPPESVTTMAVSIKDFDPSHTDIRLGILPCGSRVWSDLLVGFGHPARCCDHEGSGECCSDDVLRILRQGRFLVSADLPGRQLLMRGIGEAEADVVTCDLPPLPEGAPQDADVQRVVFGVRVVGTGSNDLTFSVGRAPPMRRPRSATDGILISRREQCRWLPCLLFRAAGGRQLRLLDQRDQLAASPMALGLEKECRAPLTEHGASAGQAEGVLS